MPHTFELKNIKHAEFASQETNCYNATLYVDGKPFAQVGNEGHGGCDFEYADPRTGLDNKAFYEKYKAITATLPSEVAYEGTSREFTMEGSIEGVCSNLLTEWLINRDIKKILKRVSVVRPDFKKGEYAQYPASVKPTPENIAKLRAQSNWKSDNIVLNELTTEQVREYI